MSARIASLTRPCFTQVFSVDDLHTAAVAMASFRADRNMAAAEDQRDEIIAALGRLDITVLTANESLILDSLSLLGAHGELVISYVQVHACEDNYDFWLQAKYALVTHAVVASMR